MRTPAPRQSMPPGLKMQIAFAICVTLFAILVLPTALSAGRAAPPIKADRSAGSVTTTTTAFVASNFEASAFSDWD